MIYPLFALQDSRLGKVENCMVRKIGALLVALLVMLWVPLAMAEEDFEPEGDAEAFYDEQLDNMQTLQNGDWTYTLLADGTAALQRYGGEAADLAVPDKLDAYPVTVIGSFCFAENNSICSLTLPATVTKLETDAFMYCTAASITLNNGLTEIGDSAFFACERLTDIVIPGSVVSIGADAFANCEDLTKATVLEGVQEIKTLAFFACDALSEVTVPQSVTAIGDSAFPGQATFVLRVTPGPFAAEYAQQNGIAVKPADPS